MNEISHLVDQILAIGLKGLRESLMMPYLVRREVDSSTNAGLGDSVSVVVPGVAEAYDVQPSFTFSGDYNLTSTSVNIPIDKWKASRLTLTDKARTQINRLAMSAEFSTSQYALSTAIDRTLLDLYKDSYEYVGSASEIAFSDGSLDILSSLKVTLDNNLAIHPYRHCVLSPHAQQGLLKNTTLQGVNTSGDSNALREGMITRLMGFDIATTSHVMNHITNIPSSKLSGSVTLSSAVAVGDTTMSFAGLAAAEEPVKGDLFSVAGSSQKFVVKNATRAGSNFNVTFSPEVTIDLAANAAVTLVGDHSAGLAFQRDAIILVSRGIVRSIANTTTTSRYDTDIENGGTGLPVLFEAVRQGMQDTYHYATLFGCAVVRPEHLVRVISRVVG